MNPMLRLRSLLLAAVLLCTWGVHAQSQCLVQWLYRMPITITNTGGALTNYQVKLIINTSTPVSQSKMKIDGSDIRFVQNPSSTCTNINYWIESAMNSTATTIWLKIPTVNPGSTVIYMYYGNSTATAASDATGVFDYFDDFNGVAPGPDWNVYGPASTVVGGGVMTMTSGASGSGAIVSTTTVPTPTIVEANVVASTGDWPTLGQLTPGSWNGYANFSSHNRGQAQVGWTSQRSPIWTGNWNIITGNPTTLGNDVGLWSFIWPNTGTQIFTWPSGAITTNYTNYALPGSIQIGIGLVENGQGSIGVDWVRARKYASPEPSLSTGNEEVIAPPVINTQPQNVTVCSGQPASFSVEATGQFLTYQWRKNGFAIPGATSSTYTIPSTVPGDAGLYDVVVRNQTVSSSALLTVNTQAGIINQPVSIAPVCPGTPVSFTVLAAGGGLTYQWRRNGTPIEGATNPTLSIPAASQALQGNYDVVVSGVCGVPVTSDVVTFGLLGVPTITEQPGSQTVCRGQVATFMVSATGEGLSYQWRRNGQPIEGATNPTLQITAQPYSAATYDVVVTGTCQPPVTSQGATLGVSLDPIITEQPLDRTATIGQGVGFRVRTMGGGILSYQWQKDGISMPGRTSDSLWIPSVGVNDIGDYNVVIRGTTCANDLTVSNKASLLIDAPPAVVKDPQDETVCEGQPVILSVTASGTGLSYQWQKNGVNIPGATGRDFRIDSALAGDAAQYRVVIKGTNNNTLTSGAATVTINTAASIATQPTDQTICPGQTATFSITAAGSGLTYQWRKNGVNIDGATSATYSIATAAMSDSGMYDVVVGGACTDSIPSTTARLVFNEAPAITEQPQAVAVGIGQPVTFTVKATGTNVTYQWRKDGANIPGATSSVYSIPAASLDQAGNYDVVVTGLCDPAATSTAVKLTVNTSSVPGDLTSAAGAMLTVVPHPAHGITQLQLHLPEGIHARKGASLMLFDATGKVALDLSESFASGNFKGAEFDAATLPSGSYYVRLTTSDWTGTVGSVVVQK